MFLINLQSKTPIYEQIQSQMMKFIDVGVMKPGDKLPSVRQLALENGINPNTVARAYTQLEKDGYVYNAPKKGVYVAEIEIEDTRKNAISSFIKPLKDMGYPKEEVLEVVHQVYS